MTQKTETGAGLFVECLVNEGVKRVYAVPGEETIALVDAILDSPIELIIARHEQHAAFMAATEGRLTGRAGVCLSTLGPGALNLATGIAHADLGGIPLVAITGQKPARENDQARFQLVDIVATFTPLTKEASAIGDVRSIPSSVRRAFRVAEAERPGPVHLELAQDIAREEADETLVPCPRVAARRPVADATSLDRAAAVVRDAARPIVIAGGGANRHRVAAALGKLADKSGLYVVTTQMGKGAFDESHPQSLLCLGAHRGDYVHEAVERADLIVTLGYSLSEYPPSVWNRERTGKILHIDTSPALPGDFYAPDCEVIGDIASTLDGLSERLERRDDAGLARAREFLVERIGAAPAGPASSPAAVVSALQSALDPQDTLVLDNGAYKFWVARGFRAERPNAVILDDALATMGAGLAGAMAAKIVEPDRRVVAVCGDGGFAMNLQDLETAVRLGLDITVVVLRDQAYGLIALKQAEAGYAQRGIEFGNPDLTKLADAFGARALTVTSSLTLAAALERAFRAYGDGRVVLIDCPIDYTNSAVVADDACEIVDMLSPGGSHS